MINGIWWNISYFDFNSEITDLACKYFGYKTGMLLPDISNQIITNLILTFSCPKNVSFFEECTIKLQQQYLYDLRTDKLFFLCSNENLLCSKIPESKNMKIEKFLGKCYYVFDSKQLVNFREMQNFCSEKTLETISLSSKDQAEFIFNIILVEKLKNVNFKNNKKNVYDKWKNIQKETLLPLSKKRI